MLRMTPIPSLAGLLRADQIAFAVRNDEEELLLKELLGLADSTWIEDVVTAVGHVEGAPEGARNKAKLLFNYDFGIELEILRYVEGPNYIEVGQIPSFRLCHIGFHVEPGQELPKVLEGVPADRFPFRTIQEVITESHTNPSVVENGRFYRYTIYDSMKTFGFNIKIIERIMPEDNEGTKKIEAPEPEIEGLQDPLDTRTPQIETTEVVLETPEDAETRVE